MINCDSRQLLLDAFFSNQETCERLVHHALSMFIQAASMLDSQTPAGEQACLVLKATVDVLQEAIENYIGLFDITAIPRAAFDCRRAATDLWLLPLPYMTTLQGQVQAYMDSLLDTSAFAKFLLMHAMHLSSSWIIEETTGIISGMHQWRDGCQRHHGNLIAKVQG